MEAFMAEFKILSKCLLVEIEESKMELSQNYHSSPAEIRTEHLLNASQIHYRFNPLARQVLSTS
jgi:hypothetical protein